MPFSGFEVFSFYLCFNLDRASGWVRKKIIRGTTTARF